MSERRSTSQLGARMARAIEPFLLLGLCAFSCEAADAPSGAPGAAAEPPSVEVAEARRAQLAPPIEAVGAIAEGELRELGFESGGRIADLRVREGDRVRRGQVLAAIDTGALDAEIGQAEARLSRVVHQAERARALRTSTVAVVPRFAEAMQAVVSGRAAVRQAREMRERAKLVAPVDGVVVKRLADPGEVTGPGLPVLVVAGAERSKVVRVGLVDRDVVRIAPGDPAVVEIDALPELRLAGTIAEVAQIPAPQTGTYEVTVALPEDAPVPRAGLVARATIEPSAKRDAVLVPVEALVDAEGDRGSVFVLARDGAHVARREVRTSGGFVGGREVGVVSGLRGGESVVVAGIDALEDGARVRVSDAAGHAR